MIGVLTARISQDTWKKGGLVDASSAEIYLYLYLVCCDE